MADAQPHPSLLTEPVEISLLERDEIRLLQFALAYRADYNGMLDGAWGPMSARSLRLYSLREFGTETLNFHLAALALEVADVLVTDGWDTFYAEPYGLSLLFPLETVSFDGRDGSFENWSHGNSSLAYSFARADINRTKGFHDFVAKEHRGRSAPYQLRRDGSAVTTAKTPGGSLYARSELVDGQWTTVILSADDRDAGLFRAVTGSINRGRGAPFLLPEHGYLSQILETLALVAEEDTTSPPPQGGRSANAGPPSGSVSSGTGFVVNVSGEILTNAHVVNGCGTFEVSGRRAELRFLSDVFDLALLAAPHREGGDHAVFAAAPARLNSDVTAAGFPYSGLLDGLNVTRGAVSSLKGLLGDSFNLQISAPVQPGNSGGPLLNNAGQVVGVVVARLDKRVVEEQTGALPENVNFAVRGEVAKLFLAQNGIAIDVAAPAPDLSPPDIADRAAAITVQITCR